MSRFCNGCGAGLKLNAKFCSSCGLEVLPDDIPVENASTIRGQTLQLIDKLKAHFDPMAETYESLIELNAQYEKLKKPGTGKDTIIGGSCILWRRTSDWIGDISDACVYRRNTVYLLLHHHGHFGHCG